MRSRVGASELLECECKLMGRSGREGTDGAGDRRDRNVLRGEASERGRSHTWTRSHAHFLCHFERWLNVGASAASPVKRIPTPQGCWKDGISWHTRYLQLSPAHSGPSIGWRLLCCYCERMQAGARLLQVLPPPQRHSGQLGRSGEGSVWKWPSDCLYFLSQIKQLERDREMWVIWGERRKVWNSHLEKCVSRFSRNMWSDYQATGPPKMRQRKCKVRQWRWLCGFLQPHSAAWVQAWVEGWSQSFC